MCPTHSLPGMGQERHHLTIAALRFIEPGSPAHCAVQHQAAVLMHERHRFESGLEQGLRLLINAHVQLGVFHAAVASMMIANEVGA